MVKFTLANQYWQQGNISKAIKVYQKLASQIKETEQYHNMAVYMLAYLYILQAKQATNDMGYLGVDLSQQHHDYYYKAALCYHQLKERDFDPRALDLPMIAATDLAAMEEAYEHRSYVNRCTNEFLPQVWKFDYLAYLRSFFASILHIRQHKTV